MNRENLFSKIDLYRNVNFYDNNNNNSLLLYD